MTRKKVKLAYISNDGARKATFKKRKKGLMKKVRELTILCGIDACAIIYSPFEREPEIWPDRLGVQQVISQCKKVAEKDKKRKLLNQERFLREMILKTDEQVKKLKRDNREKEVLQVLIKSVRGEVLHNLGIVDLNDLGWLVDKSSKEIEDKMNSLRPVALQEENRDQAAKNMMMDNHIPMDAISSQEWFTGFIKIAENRMNLPK